MPEPVSYKIFKEKFFLNQETTINFSRELLKIAEDLKELISLSTGFDLEINEISEKITTPSIDLNLNETLDLLDSEGYLLEIKPQNIIISANSSAGIFYGIQSLRQLFPNEVESNDHFYDIEWSLPCVYIQDFPRFSWRGYMLDEARHFHGKQIVKNILDIMALLKLNIFHWHLTDDQGWRIEIKKYPKLVEIGSKREEIQSDDISNRETKKIPHSGYYLQEDILEIIDYARERFITIVPEIDMPGHTRAAIASYPYLSCREYKLWVSPHWGIHRDVLCVGKEKVFDFVQDVLTEVMGLFPSKMIHIGGDEVPTDRWQECKMCQLRLNREGFTNYEELQIYFTNRMINYLRSLGARVIGWNEILHENLKEDVICQYWIRGEHKVLKYLRKGGKVITSNFKYTYLDHSYSFTPLKLAYNFEPIPKELEKQYHQNILGLEALMWGELIPTTERLEWQTFPRLIAFSEVGWTQKNKKNYRSFLNRLEHFLKRLDLLNVKYASQEDMKRQQSKKQSNIYGIPQ
ncbi:MAG: beta-N-acetylhexosaminidase [Candidatus Thorarchaeota archaeon]